MPDAQTPPEFNPNDVAYARKIAERLWAQFPFEVLQAYETDLKDRDQSQDGDILYMEFLDKASSVLLEAIQKLTGGIHAGICPRCGTNPTELDRIRKTLRSRIEAAAAGVAKRRESAEARFQAGIIPKNLGLTAKIAKKHGFDVDPSGILNALLSYTESYCDPEEVTVVRNLINDALIDVHEQSKEEPPNDDNAGTT